MKAVILAAGRGTRMGVLTGALPKPLLKFGGKTLLENTLSVIPGNCSEIIIVTGYLGEKIRTAFGNSWNSIPIRYVHQETLNGTGGALWNVQEYLKEEHFLVLPSDDVYSATDIQVLCSAGPAMLVSEVVDREVSGGCVKVDEHDQLVSIVEGTHGHPCLVATGAYFLTSELFTFPLVQIPGREEYGLPQSVILYSKEYSVQILRATFWKQIVTSEDVDR